MEQKPLSYVEKLENLYILTETRNMLENKISELMGDSQSVMQIQEDLNKINREIESYTNGFPIEELEDTMSQSLFDPTVLYDFDYLE